MKLDLGCGKNKIGPDWTGVDSRPFPGVDVVLDLAQRAHDAGCNTHVGASRCDCSANARDRNPPFAPWPWPDASVDEAHSSHFVEHLTAPERAHFVNELYRVLKPGAQARIITPYWASERAYGDLTHQWPPVVGFWWLYLSTAWRADNAPHNNDLYTCDFGVTWVYSLSPDIVPRSAEYQQDALAHWVNSAQDMIATLTKK